MTQNLTFLVKYLILSSHLLAHCGSQAYHHPFNITPTTWPITVTIYPPPTPIVSNPHPEILRRLTEQETKIDNLQFAMTRINVSLLTIISEWQLHQHQHLHLLERVTALEKADQDLKTAVDQELVDFRSTIDIQVAEFRSHHCTNSEMDALGAVVNGTQRQLRALETGKVQLLLNHDEMWKRNFRVINSTLFRLGKGRRNG